MFAAMTMCGYQAAMLLRTAWTKRVKALALFGYAAGLFALGGIASIWIPVIKPIYTLSFTALAMGWCVLALAVLYVACDIFLFRRGTALVLLFGQGALAALKLIRNRFSGGTGTRPPACACPHADRLEPV